MQDASNPKPSHFLKSEGVRLALLPILGSAVAYLYEFGYVSHFDVPPSLIQIDVTRILAATAILSFLVPPYLLMLSYGFDFTVRDEPIRRAIGRSIMYAVLSVPVVFLLTTITYRWTTVLVILACGLAYELLPAFFRKAGGGTYRERLRSLQLDESARLKTNEEPPSEVIRQRLVGPIGIVLFLGFMVVRLGSTWAEGRTRFWVLSERPDTVLVAQYGDIAVFRVVDLSTKVMRGELLVMKFSDEPIKLDINEIGPIKKPTKGKNGG